MSKIKSKCVILAEGTGAEMAYPGPRLGNFNYDIARSVQTYNVPIYGLEQGQSASLTINQMANSVIAPLPVQNVTAHSGHGNATGAECDNSGILEFEQNPEHLGFLEYVSFRLCQAECWESGNSTTDYCFDVPSPWDSFISV